MDSCIYPYFFTMEIDGILITDTIKEMYQTWKILDFMKESYSYCIKHDVEIRKHIEKIEQSSGLF